MFGRPGRVRPTERHSAVKRREAATHCSTDEPRGQGLSGGLCPQLLGDSASVRSREGPGHGDPRQRVLEQPWCALPAQALPRATGQEATSGGVRSSHSSPVVLRIGQVRRQQPLAESVPAGSHAPGGAETHAVTDVEPGGSRQRICPRSRGSPVPTRTEAEGTLIPHPGTHAHRGRGHSDSTWDSEQRHPRAAPRHEARGRPAPAPSRPRVLPSMGVRRLKENRAPFIKPLDPSLSHCILWGTL